MRVNPVEHQIATTEKIKTEGWSEGRSLKSEIAWIFVLKHSSILNHSNFIIIYPFVDFLFVFRTMQPATAIILRKRTNLSF